jgi:aerotaxis receptor
MTGQERKFSENATLVSVTNLKGVIQYCNNDFIEISGYSEKELINAHHNIVRHQDMPKAAFEDLWKTIKNDKPWQGIVKNRCKNGDYYWVDAYVTPVFESGKKVGYQSVRSYPTQKQVKEAEILYRELNADSNKKIPKVSAIRNINITTQVNIMVSLILLSFLITQWKTDHLFNLDPWDLVTNIWIVSLLLALITLCHLGVGQRIKGLNQTIKRISAGDLTERIDMPKRDELGEVIMSIKMLQGRLKAVIGRFSESTQNLVATTDILSDISYQTKLSMDKQHLETELVATAMTEMSSTVAEIAQSTTNTSRLANDAAEATTMGNQLVISTRETVIELSSDISHVSALVNSLAEECAKIIDITDSISGIAEQTNLLALNAAIEAARAGEYGRGFAVVADEVRSLSSRTQNATIDINKMIDSLQHSSKTATKAMADGLSKVQDTVENIENTEAAFSRITQSVADVNDLNMQIATAAEEQSCVAEEMNTNVNSISEQSHSTSDYAQRIKDKTSELIDMTNSLKLQLEQYNLGDSAISFDFGSAKTAHLAWKTRVRDFIQGDTHAITKEQACSHHECQLGRWYYSPAATKYKQSSYFQQIEAPHARLHAIVREVLEAKDQGHLEKAERLYSELGPMSDQIVSLLDKTEHSIR